VGKKARIVPQRPPTRRQLARWQRERRAQRLIIAGGLSAILLVVGISLFGFYQEFVAKAQEPIARVDDHTFPLGEYAQTLGLRRYLLDAQIENLQRVLAQGVPVTSTLESLQQARSSLSFQVVEDWIAEQLVRQETSRLGITVSAQEVTQAIKSKFVSSLASEGQSAGAPQAPTSTVTTTTPTSGTAGGQAKEAAAEEEFQASYRAFLKRAKTTDARYRRLIEWTLLAGKLQEYLAKEVKSTAPQVHLLAILVNSQQEAQTVLDRLKKGEDFAQVAREVSQDAASKENGGDIGWVPRGLLERELEEAAFSLSQGQVSRPISTKEGYYILKVLEKADSREIEPAILERIKAGALDRWLERAETQHRVERYITSDKLNWAEAQLEKR
jgi:parvulin-like peptidyl-prolyl isomerase